MPASFIGDPTRMRLWLKLHQAAMGIRQVHRWRAADGGRPEEIRGHQHVVPTLSLCIEGVARVQGAKAVDLRPGDALVIAPGCWHEHVRLRAGSAAFGLGFIAGKCDVLLVDPDEVSWGMISGEPFRGMMDQLMAAESAEERARLVAAICTQIFNEKASPIRWLHPAVQRMASALWKRLHTPITAADIVRAAASGPDGIGHSRAYQLFTAFFGATPKQVLLTQRLDLAAQLLSEGATVAEAASRCGFSSRADLTRAWRRRHGRPPSATVKPARSGKPTRKSSAPLLPAPSPVSAPTQHEGW
jgi:AraC-like DNA-binding protein